MKLSFFEVGFTCLVFSARKRDNAIMKLAKKSNVEVELLTMSVQESRLWMNLFSFSIE